MSAMERSRDRAGSAGGRGGVDAVVYLLEESFRGPGIEASNESQALLPNLATVGDQEWRALVRGAARSIEHIAIHVGACTVMYDDYASGSASLRFGTREVEPWTAEGPAPRADVLEWLAKAHARLVEHILALRDDAELLAPRRTNWGEERETRWIVAAMVTHNAYHAGEINHIRSLLQGDDRWRYVQLGFG
jgi:uncharacterized damage-inducible protein DinB